MLVDLLGPGNGWTGAHSWMQNWPDTSDNKISNADAFVNFTDPSSNWAFEMHQYLDADASGSKEACASATTGEHQLLMRCVDCVAAD